MKFLKLHLALIIEAVALTSLFAFVCFLDSSLGASLYWRFYAVVLGLALLLTGGTLLLGPRKPTLLLLGLFNLGFGFLHFTSFGWEKSFMVFHRQIHEGMTPVEVTQLFEARFPTGGRYPRPVGRWKGGAELDYWLNARRDPMDSITVTFRNGRVVKTEYLSD